MCDTTHGGVLSTLFVAGIAVVVVYICFRKLLTFRRQQRLKKLGAARVIFRDMDTDSSGRITREEMRNSLAVLGLEVSLLEGYRVENPILQETKLREFLSHIVPVGGVCVFGLRLTNSSRCKLVVKRKPNAPTPRGI
jgi:hypothetical protein